MKKSIIGLFAAIMLVSMTGCKNGVSGGGSSNPYKKTGTQEINGKSYDIVTFGSFPQSEKTDDTITVNESEAKTAGSYTYYKGSDNEWYAKLGSKYFKVEPIKWRVLTTDYNGTKKKLLLAENIIINKAYDASSNNYENSSIRAYLTGDFYNTAFTTEEQNAIAITTVINDARSTNPDGDSNVMLWNNGENQYASDTATSDKIFLLSEQEVTKDDYGFATYNAYGTDSTRIRKVTAFARESGTWVSTDSGYEDGGYWWLRSPIYTNSITARYVYIYGYAYYNLIVNYAYMGVVPALCLN
ncbi:MAG: hypothetical protein IKX23_10655 [Treponema sp.]|nr:hypothetical protein [Treponema sp.]